jgi:hypothetical protein
VAVARDDDARQRRADLTGEEALGAGDGVGDRLQIDVVEDHCGRLAAQLQRATRDPPSADRGDLPPRSRGAGECDLVDARVADQEFGDLAVGGHDVEHARRQTDRLGDLGQDIALSGRLGRGLQDLGAAGQERWGHLVGDQAHRGVPRDDRPDDTDGLAHQQAERAPVGRPRLLLKRIGVRQRGVVLKRPGSALGGVLGDAVQDAGLPRPDVAHLVTAATQRGGDRPQVPGSCLGIAAGCATLAHAEAGRYTRVLAPDYCAWYVTTSWYSLRTTFTVPGK